MDSQRIAKSREAGLKPPLISYFTESLKYELHPKHGPPGHDDARGNHPARALDQRAGIIQIGIFIQDINDVGRELQRVVLDPECFLNFNVKIKLIGRPAAPPRLSHDKFRPP